MLQLYVFKFVAIEIRTIVRTSYFTRSDEAEIRRVCWSARRTLICDERQLLITFGLNESVNP